MKWKGGALLGVFLTATAIDGATARPDYSALFFYFLRTFFIVGVDDRTQLTSDAGTGELIGGTRRCKELPN
jgi:hypothetical protein